MEWGSDIGSQMVARHVETDSNAMCEQMYLELTTCDLITQDT